MVRTLGRVVEWLLLALTAGDFVYGVGLLVAGQSGTLQIVGAAAFMALVLVIKLERRVEQLREQLGKALQLNQRMLDLIDKGLER